MRQASRSYALSQGDPNVKPIPFVIPSESWSDQWSLQYKFKRPEISEEDWQYEQKIPKYSIVGQVYLSGNVNNGKVIWKEIKAEIYINGCTFQDVFSASYSKINNIVFTNCAFLKGISFRDFEGKEITFRNCSFSKSKLSIFNSNIGLLNIIECDNLQLDISIDLENKYISSWTLLDSIEHKIDSVQITSSRLNSINCYGKAIYEFKMKDIECKEASFNLDVSRFYISNEYVTTNNNNDGKFFIDSFLINVNSENINQKYLIRNLHFGKFSLSGTVNNSSIFISHVKFDNFKISNFVNEGKVRFYNLLLSEGGSVEIIESQLGKSEFNTVDFSRAKLFKIYLSSLTDIIIHNTLFPTNILGKNNTDYKGKREIYRYLKNASGKQGDRINELRYEEAEMEAFKSDLSDNQKNNDIWILRLNEWSNRHGQDWERAACRLLSCSFVLFFIIKLCLGYTKFDIFLIFNDLSSFINFTLNSLHKFSEIFQKSDQVFLNGIAQFLDTTARLFSGFMLFQFLRAFRKYAR